MDRISEVARKIQSTLGTLPEQLNDRIPVVLRRRCFTPASLAQSFILALLQKPTANDADIAAIASALGVPVTPQAIQQRFTEPLASFFQSLFEQIASESLRPSKTICHLLDRFTKVIAIDSTVIALPPEMAGQFPGCGGGGPASGNTAALKLQTELNLKTGALECVQLEAGRNPDGATDRQQVKFERGSLRLADLGYFSLEVLSRIVADGAHFISRIQFQTRVKIDGQSKSVIDHLREKPSEIRSIDTRITLGKKQQLECRLIAWRVPHEIAARRRQLLNQTYRKRGKTPSEGALAACDWSMLITDMPAEKLTLQEVIVLYRSRWQIELLFKRWKSYCRIDLLDGPTPVHVRCRLWIRLCAAAIQQQMIAACCWSGEHILSFAKVCQRLQHCVIRLCCAVDRARTLATVIRTFAAECNKTCRRTKRRKKPGWIELLRNPNCLEFDLTSC